MLTYIIQEYIKKNSTPWPSRVYSKDVIWLINKNLMYEVSQKDKDHYSILTHIYGIQKDGNDNPICKTEEETQMYRTDFWTMWEKVRVGCFKRTALKHVYYLG